MPRKLDRAPRKSAANDDCAEAVCNCKCRPGTDKSGEKTAPSVDSISLHGSLDYDIHNG